MTPPREFRPVTSTDDSALDLEALKAQLEAAEQDVHELTKALTGLTVGGSEFFVRKRGRYVADIKFCVEHVRDRERRQHNLIIDATRRAQKAEKALAALQQGGGDHG